uniref:Uncharacterized protein n=1 Tax=Glossina palpalis gambiensis TaxID=67801 RepID=A0A1B0BYP5_9MUSC
MFTKYNYELHDVLSRPLREYPDLRRPWRASPNRFYKELARGLSVELNCTVTVPRVIRTLQTVRDAFKKLEAGSAHTALTSYVWYAEELICKQAAKTMRRLLAREKAAKEDTRRKKNFVDSKRARRFSKVDNWGISFWTTFEKASNIE